MVAGDGVVVVNKQPLPTETEAGPVAGHRWSRSRATLARFSTALLLLATMAMSLGTGMRWWFE